MSDEEYEYDYGSEGEYDYGSDQGEENNEDGGNDILIEIENSFYEGDDLKSENPSKAIQMFEKVVELETNNGDTVKWRFKALQHLVILYFGQEQFDKMIDRYRGMLAFISSVTRNECTDAINAILDTLTNSTNSSVLSQMYEITLVALKTANNERLWFNTNLKLAKLYLDDKKFDEVENKIAELKKTCQLPDGSDDINKGSYLLEIYCLEIQMCSATLNTARMKKIYPRTLKLNAAVADPRIMGVIREEGGMMQMAEGNWREAYDELYEAFRNYQEAGSARARDCLKYVVLASMLSLSDINPFAAREAKVFADDREILAMSDLRQSLEANDLKRFERTIRNKQNRIMEEQFLMTYIQPLRRRMWEQVLLNLTRPYRKVTLTFLARELDLTESVVEEILVDMILDDRIHAQIDQTNGHVYLSAGNKEQSLPKINALSKWADALTQANETYSNRLVM